MTNKSMVPAEFVKTEIHAGEAESLGYLSLEMIITISPKLCGHFFQSK